MKLNVTVDVPLTLEQLAGLFVELDDDSQAKFFVEVARLMQSWTPHERNMQAHYIGRHLRDCSCSTEEARELLVAIVESMQSKPIEVRYSVRPKTMDLTGEMTMAIPRRVRLDLMTPTEVALRTAMAAIEAMPADRRLTEASAKVSQALDLVGSFIDDQLRDVQLI